MNNRNTEITWGYHNGTKHPGGRLLDRKWRYDWDRRPLLYKIYENLEPIPLPLDKSPSGVSALEAIATAHVEDQAAPLDLETLARLLYFSAGITKRIDYGPPRGEMAFRAASCTGALYHIELYAVCADLPDLEAGVYHFDPRGPALKQLRRGDYRAHLARAAGSAGADVEAAPATLVFSDVFWRNAVKYQAREYRHAFWDLGTILSQTLALAVTHRLPARVVLGFVDEMVNNLLGLAWKSGEEVDAAREAALALLPLGDDARMPPDSPPVTQLDLEVRPISEMRLEARAAFLTPVLAMHDASTLPEPEAAAEWGGQAPEMALPAAEASPFPLADGPDPNDPLERVIIRRGSSRRFRQEPITLNQLADLLRCSTQGFASDFGTEEGLALNHLYLIVNSVEGLPAGTYLYRPQEERLELLQEPPEGGTFRDEAGHLALGQYLARDAAVNIYMITDLEPVLERFGNRGYRAAQLEASVIAGRIYLAAYAHEIGATGLTFYDDGVTEFFSPSAAGKSVMFLMAAGIPAPRKS